MARTWNRLTANFVRSVTKLGRYADGGNLHLQIARGGTKAWVFLYQRNGVSRAMGLGSLRSVPLAIARELAAQAREQLARGFDPIDTRKAAALEQRAARAKLTTFAQNAKEYFEANAPRWSNQKHEWWSAVSRHALPVLGDMAVGDIDSNLVLRVLLPLAERPVTAARLRGRIEAVLAFAEAAGRRTGDNPARKEVIAHLLPLRSQAVNHQPALPFGKVPALMKLLRATPGTDARLLETIILTALRHTAVRLARFDEFDVETAVWIVSKDRTKSLGRDHRVPLPRRLVEIVRELRDGQPGGEYVFGGDWPIGKNAAGKALEKLLKDIGHDEPVSVHGFRASFKDWVHETRDHPHEVVEQALGHRIKSGVERAYRRGDLLERRRHLMADWENYCNGEPVGEIIKLRA